MRMFNPTDIPAAVKISSPARMSAVYLTDLAEHRQKKCARARGSVTLELQPHRIQTIEIVPQRH